MNNQLPQTRQIVIEGRVYTITFTENNGYTVNPGTEALPITKFSSYSYYPYSEEWGESR